MESVKYALHFLFYMSVAKKKKNLVKKKTARKKTGKTPATLAIKEFEPLKRRLYNIRDIGRPLKYKTPDEMAIRIEEYFEWIKGEYEEKITLYKDRNGNRKKHKEKVCVRDPEPPTITGLLLFLGFCGRDAFDTYLKKHHDYSDIIRAARTAIEHGYEKRLHGDRCTGAIFALKQFGWKDTILTDPDEEQLPTGFNYVTPKEPQAL